MRCIIGLGNPGNKYELTRHNAGFMALDVLTRSLDGASVHMIWKKENKLESSILKLPYGQDQLLLVKPWTFMNLSGRAVNAVLSYYRLSISDFLVIQDDLDLPCGRIRLKLGGGNAGHNGIESINQALKDQPFQRLRIGIGQKDWFTDGAFQKSYRDAADYVLAKFSSQDLEHLAPVWELLPEVIGCILKDGFDRAMNIYNSTSN